MPNIFRIITVIQIAIKIAPDIVAFIKDIEDVIVKHIGPEAQKLVAELETATDELKKV